MKLARFAVVPGGASLPGLARAVGARHTAPPPPPPAPPPQVTLAMTQLVGAAPDQGWELKLTNTGTIPVRIVADPRLYSFEIAPPAGSAPAAPPPTAKGRRAAPRPQGPVKCALPADMIPSTDTERTLTLVAGRSWTVSIDPRLFCFSAAQGNALAPGAVVTATFGWMPSRATPPYAVAPILTSNDADAGVGPARNIIAQPVTLAAPQALDGGAGPAMAVSDAGAAQQPALSDAYPVHLKVTMGDRLDVSRVFEQTVTVTIANEGDRPVRSLFTPATTGFTVTTPRGVTVNCGAMRAVSILPELAGGLSPRGRTAVSVDLGAVCPDVFRKPGLYRVRPRFDASHASGPGSYYTGKAVGEPMLLRVRQGEDPLPPPRVDPL